MNNPPVHYNSWPLGKIPAHLQRPEPEQARNAGYDWSDARELNTHFEARLAEYTGAPYVVLTDCCTNAIFVTLKYLQASGAITDSVPLSIPARTYVSVPMAIHNAGLKFTLDDRVWSGEYEIGETQVFDSAARFSSKMFQEDAFAQCLSFQIKKRLPIGRGGAILTANKTFADWARLAVYDGRDLNTPYDSPDHVTQIGWHAYMTPEDAARGLLILDGLELRYPDTMNQLNYPDLRQWPAVTKYMVEK